MEEDQQSNLRVIRIIFKNIKNGKYGSRGRSAESSLLKPGVI
jgi:hypothetical protein